MITSVERCWLSDIRCFISSVGPQRVFFTPDCYTWESSKDFVFIHNFRFFSINRLQWSVLNYSTLCEVLRYFQCHNDQVTSGCWFYPEADFLDRLWVLCNKTLRINTILEYKNLFQYWNPEVYNGFCECVTAPVALSYGRSLNYFCSITAGNVRYQL